MVRVQARQPVPLIGTCCCFLSTENTGFTVKTASSATAVQAIRYRDRKRIVVKHIGSAHAQEELLSLKQTAQKWIDKATKLLLTTIITLIVENFILVALIWTSQEKRAIRVINLISRQSIEERMPDVLAFKSSLFKGVLDNGEQVTNLSQIEEVPVTDEEEMEQISSPATEVFNAVDKEFFSDGLPIILRKQFMSFGQLILKKIRLSINITLL